MCCFVAATWFGFELKVYFQFWLVTMAWMSPFPEGFTSRTPCPLTPHPDMLDSLVPCRVQIGGGGGKCTKANPQVCSYRWRPRITRWIILLWNASRMSLWNSSFFVNLTQVCLLVCIDGFSHCSVKHIHLWITRVVCDLQSAGKGMFLLSSLKPPVSNPALQDRLRCISLDWSICMYSVLIEFW